jgi:hypothetical protein
MSRVPEITNKKISFKRVKNLSNELKNKKDLTTLEKCMEEFPSVFNNLLTMFEEEMTLVLSSENRGSNKNSYEQ